MKSIHDCLKGNSDIVEFGYVDPILGDITCDDFEQALRLAVNLKTSVYICAWKECTAQEDSYVLNRYELKEVSE